MYQIVNVKAYKGGLEKGIAYIHKKWDAIKIMLSTGTPSATHQQIRECSPNFIF